MTSPRLLISLALTLTVLTSVAECACYSKSLVIVDSQETTVDGTALSVYCEYRNQQKPLFNAWVDLDACAHCVCLPSGLRCCSFGEGPGSAMCRKSSS